MSEQDAGIDQWNEEARRRVTEDQLIPCSFPGEKIGIHEDGFRWETPEELGLIRRKAEAFDVIERDRLITIPWEDGGWSIRQPRGAFSFTGSTLLDAVEEWQRNGGTP